MNNQDFPTLKYIGKSASVAPIVSENELQTVTAEPWVKISDRGLQ
ncbi:lactonase, partial [Staphylococcus ureilyticus]